MIGLFITVPTCAVSSDNLKGLVGYIIIASKTIDGYRNRGKNGKRRDDLEGCDFDRVIVFKDGTHLTCAEYGYRYAYAPTAIIFAKQMFSGNHTFHDFKLLVEHEVYDMRK